MLAMMVPFAIVAVLMVVLIVYGARVCMYYVSPYARCVKRGYYQAMRDPRAKLQNRLGSIVARMSDKSGPYVLFDILLPATTETRCWSTARWSLPKASRP